jgi:hypothetical protein
MDCWDQMRDPGRRETSLEAEPSCNVDDRDSLAIQDIPLEIPLDETNLRCDRKGD